MVGGQTSGIQNSSLRAETRNLEIQDGEDVDVLRRPGHNLDKKIRSVVLRPFKFVWNALSVP